MTQKIFSALSFCAAFFATLALAGCASVPDVRAQFLEPGFAIEEVGKGGSAVAVTLDPSILEFRRSYTSAYGTYDSLARSVSRRIVKGLGPSSTVLKMNGHVANAIALLNDSAQAARNAEFLKSTGAKYLVHVRNLVITERISTRQDDEDSFAVVLFKVDVWDVESRRLLATFEADGLGRVTLFDYEGALVDAVQEACDNTARYLATGQMTWPDPPMQKSGSPFNP